MNIYTRTVLERRLADHKYALECTLHDLEVAKKRVIYTQENIDEINVMIRSIEEDLGVINEDIGWVIVDD